MSASADNTVPQGFFSEDLAASDPDVFESVGRELARQQRQIELI